MAYDKLVDSTVLDGLFSNIADAIRNKNGTANEYTPEQMPQAIEDIPSGGDVGHKTITQNGVYNAEDDNYDGYDVVTVNVPTLSAAYKGFLARAASPSFPSDLTVLGDYACYNYTALGSSDIANLPATLQEIGDYCFANLSSLGAVDLSDKDLRTLGEYVFNGSGLTTLDLSGNTHLTAIPDNFLRGIKTTNIDLTNCPIVSIGDYAFYREDDGSSFLPFPLFGCTTLKSIGDYAFYNQKRNYSYEYDLSGCTALETIGEGAFCSEPLSSTGYKGVTSKVVLPASIITVGNRAFVNNKLTVIDLSRCVNLKSLGNNAFTYSSSTVATLDLSPCVALETIGDSCFGRDSNPLKIQSLTMPSQVLTSIGTNAFKGSVLANTSTLNVKTASLGQQAFYGCTGIVTLYLTVDRYYNNAFQGCTGLREIHIESTPTGAWPSNITSNPVFNGCTGVTDIYVPWSQGDIPETNFFKSAQNPIWHYNTV